MFHTKLTLVSGVISNCRKASCHFFTCLVFNLRFWRHAAGRRSVTNVSLFPWTSKTHISRPCHNAVHVQLHQTFDEWSFEAVFFSFTSNFITHLTERIFSELCLFRYSMLWVILGRLIKLYLQLHKILDREELLGVLTVTILRLLKSS